jgi:hypothetical protein
MSEARRDDHPHPPSRGALGILSRSAGVKIYG